MAEDTIKQFSITIAADSADFLRHECPRCGLEFKLKDETMNEHDELSWWLQETLRESGLESEEDQQELPSVYCPYCGEVREKQDFTHPELVAYIEQIAWREFVEPMLAGIFQGFTSGFRPSKHLKVTISEPSGRSPRPISGPEPDDQVAVRCCSCECQFKVHEDWRGTVLCPSCSAELVTQ